MTVHDSTASVIALRNISKCFGAVNAVTEVDLDILPGEMFGLIGHNGAGKSTLFKMMLGLLEPSDGSILVHGTATTSPAFRAVRRQIGYLPENVVLYDNLTGLETLQFFGRLKGVPASNCGETLERVGLSHAADRRVHGYSKGMRQRLGLAQALLGTPHLLFLDEPTSGLDPEAIRHFYVLLNELRQHGVTLIISSHILAEIQQRVDRLAILAGGRVRALGTLQSLRDQIHLTLRIVAKVASEQITGAIANYCVSRGMQVDATHAGQLTIHCNREQKMPILQYLGQLTEAVTDVQIHEPSLEDVFFGFAG